jgi:hypothetical protein
MNTQRVPMRNVSGACYSSELPFKRYIMKIPFDSCCLSFILFSSSYLSKFIITVHSVPSNTNLWPSSLSRSSCSSSSRYRPFCLSPPHYLPIFLSRGVYYYYYDYYYVPKERKKKKGNIFTIYLLSVKCAARHFFFSARDKHAKLVITQSALQLPTLVHTFL